MKEYSTRSTAVRGAKRAGLIEGEYEIGPHPDNADMWAIIPLTKDTETTQDEGLPQGEEIIPDVPEIDPVPPAERPAPGTLIHFAPGGKVIPVTKGTPYKVLARRAPSKSVVTNPVVYIHAFLDARRGISRQQAIGELVDLGINLSTAKTQYQRWFQEQPK